VKTLWSLSMSGYWYYCIIIITISFHLIHPCFFRLLATEPFLLLHGEHGHRLPTNLKLLRLISSWSENISVSFCLRTPEYGLTLWCALGLLVGGAIQVLQLLLLLLRVVLQAGCWTPTVVLRSKNLAMSLRRWRQTQADTLSFRCAKPKMWNSCNLLICCVYLFHLSDCFFTWGSSVLSLVLNLVRWKSFFKTKFKTKL